MGFNGETGKRGAWSCVSQRHFLCNEMYTEVLVESRHGLRKIFICFISAKRVCPYVDPANQDKDTHI